MDPGRSFKRREGYSTVILPVSTTVLESDFLATLKNEPYQAAD
jgi:hypothetical protein